MQETPVRSLGQEDPLVKETKGLKKEKSKYSTLLNNTEKYLTITQQFVIIFYRTQTVKRLSTMRETQIRALGWEDPLEKEMAIHSSTIAWKIPWTEEPGRLQSLGSQRVGHEFTFTFTLTLVLHILGRILALGSETCEALYTQYVNC